MGYSTNTSLLIILPGLPQTTTTEKYTETVSIIDSHITRADNLINGKIAARYDVSQFSSNVPPLLKTIAEDITSFYVFSSLYSSDNQNYSAYLDKFQEAKETLDEIKKGDIDLVDSAGNVISEREEEIGSGLVSSNTEDYQPFFDEDESTDWKVDSDKGSEISDSR